MTSFIPGYDPNQENVITRKAGILNDIDMTIQDMFNLDEYTAWKFNIKGPSGNIWNTKTNADMLRTDQQLYWQHQPGEFKGHEGPNTWELIVTNDEGPQSPGEGPFIILK